MILLSSLLLLTVNIHGHSLQKESSSSLSGVGMEPEPRVSYGLPLPPRCTPAHISGVPKGLGINSLPVYRVSLSVVSPEHQATYHFLLGVFVFRI